ncbi:MAG: SPFH domain-containing protein [Ginsengibacter sp.]
MKSKSLFSGFIFVIIIAIGLVWARSLYSNSTIAGSAFIIALFISSAIKIADPWDKDKAVVLRLGHFQSLRGPGLFFIVPVIDTIPYWIDTRVITTSFKAKKNTTKDTVPVYVDPVLLL